MQRILWVLLFAALLSPAPRAAPTPPSTLDGEWEMVAVTTDDGTPLTPEDIAIEKGRCSIKGNVFLFQKDGVSQNMTFSVNWKASPPQIDFVLPDGKGVNHAIIALEKGRFRLCVGARWRANKSAERPKAFDPLDIENKHLTHKMLLTFQRKK